MSQVTIHRIPSGQFPDSLALSEFSFQYKIPPEEWEKKLSQLKENEQWGAYVDGKLAAKLTILELHTWIQGKRWKLGGIASVATWPEYRRGGLVAGLLTNALRVMREEGQYISFLHPFQFAFYRKFGWETYTETKKYEIATALLPKLPSQPGRVVRVGEDNGLLGSIYTSFAQRYNGTLDRDEAWWTNRIFPVQQGTAAVYYNEAGEPRGYVRYQIKDRVCDIHELVYLDRESWKGLWRFIADHDSMMEKVKISAPGDDQLPFLLDNPRIKQETSPYFMARLVDAAKFIELYPFIQPPSGAVVSLELKVTDSHAAWNDGVFLIEVRADGTAKVEKREQAAGVTGRPQVECDISTLSTLLMGYQSASFLYEIERLRGNEEGISLLEALIPKRTTYLPDFF
ncbi:GNAT family N-acetyltransferase [Paenibacillus rigui]|uniref:GNAT family N-acetyltransferase n=1 Tax=Paenibacillus rigui TaxID=554312 RepID=A0A229UJ40_9BACL|nr:GNAT family N-acetyltransferase [Paenibacillus rigui]OXM83371.1 GNAT family N-acetyltransferase [Paenibacillus rigui]